MNPFWKADRWLVRMVCDSIPRKVNEKTPGHPTPSQLRNQGSNT